MKGTGGGGYTFAGQNSEDSVLISPADDVTSLVDNSSNNVGASNTALTRLGGVKNRRLEVSINLRVQLSVVREHDRKSLILINNTKLDIRRSSTGLQEVSMVSSNLETVGASDLHKGLVSSLSVKGMRQFGDEFLGITLLNEVGVKEGLASGRSGDVANGCKINIGSGSHEEVTTDSRLDHLAGESPPGGIPSLEESLLLIGVIELAVLPQCQAVGTPGRESRQGTDDLSSGGLKCLLSHGKRREEGRLAALDVNEKAGEVVKEVLNNGSKDFISIHSLSLGTKTIT